MGVFSRARKTSTETDKREGAERADIVVNGVGVKNGATEANGAGGASLAGEARLAGDAPVADPNSPPQPGAVAQAAVPVPVPEESEVIELDSIEPLAEPPEDDRPVTAPHSPGARAFAIADAIRLLQSLPAAPRADMVARLVRVTVGAVNVSVQDLSYELSRQMQALERQERLIKAEVEALEKRIQGKRAALAAQQGEREQLAQVRARLHAVDRPASHRPPPIPRDALKQARFPQAESAPAE